MKRIYFLGIAVVFLLSSCRKEVVQQIEQRVDQAYSAVYTIQPGDWFTENNGKTYSAELEVPELDNVIYQDGAVLVFIQFEGENYFEALPQVFDGISYGVIHNNGYVVIDLNDIGGGNINPPGVRVTAKVILIDAVRLALHRNLDLRNLAAVQQALGIK